MKNFFLLLFLFVNTIIILPQSKEYSLTFNSGVFIPANEQYSSTQFKVGTNLGLEFQNYSYPWSFFTELNINLTNINKNGYQNYNPVSLSSVIEITAGPRYFYKGDKLQPFFDLGVGAYLVNESGFTFTSEGNEYSVGTRSRTNLGLSLGIGSVVYLSKDFDILIKAKFHPYFVGGEGGFGIKEYFGIYGGLKYNFKF